jgi:hypothetical protein
VLTHADERRGEERGAAFPDRHRQWERQGQGTAFFLVPSVAFFVAFLGPFFLRAPSLDTPWSCKRNLPGFLFAIFSRDLFYCPFFASHMTWHAKSYYSKGFIEHFLFRPKLFIKKN